MDIRQEVPLGGQLLLPHTFQLLDDMLVLFVDSVLEHLIDLLLQHLPDALSIHYETGDLLAHLRAAIAVRLLGRIGPGVLLLRKVL